MNKPIPVAGPSITAKEIAYVSDACAGGWYERAGEFCQRFEAGFAEYLGSQHAIALPSCTSAIHLALAAMGVGPGDEVIVPDITWIASAAPVHYVGAQPVFADVDAGSWCLSAESFAECITPRTRAVIVVDLYGGMPDMAAIRRVADRHQIRVIEDAAQAVGTQFDGRAAGRFGDVGVFSFHGSKTLTTGEGGMLVTDRSDIADRARFLADHGRRPGDVSFENREIAYKYKMSNLQAALGLAQLERVSELVAQKQRIFEWYAEQLGHLPQLTLNPSLAGVSNSYWMTTVALAPELDVSKQPLISELKDRRIDCRPFFSPLSSLPAYRDDPQAELARRRNRSAYRISPFAINLPSPLELTRRQAVYVSQQLRDAITCIVGSNAWLRAA